jgi:hypothetical protein
MASKIRPRLLFWTGRDNVGGARAVWHRGPDGAVGFELLIGSDPGRAPRRINRWGYIAEEVRGPEARLLGVMKQSTEQSLEDAQSRLASEAQEGQYVFKAIRAVASASEASSRIVTIRVARDLTFRDLETLLDPLYGTSGPLAEIPVHAVYQPRWWLEVELLPDDEDQS